jgi:hypothetical protein
MFLFEPPKGEEAHRTLSRRAHMRKTCNIGCRLGSGAEASQGASPPLGNQHPRHQVAAISLSIVESSNLEASSFGQQWIKLIKMVCMKDS